MLLARTGKAIDISQLEDDYTVPGNKAELANELVGHADFVSALRRVSPKPTVRLGMSLSVDKDQEGFCVFVPKVLKDVHELNAIIELTKGLLDLLAENCCLEKMLNRTLQLHHESDNNGMNAEPPTARFQMVHQLRRPR